MQKEHHAHKNGWDDRLNSAHELDIRIISCNLLLKCLTRDEFIISAMTLYARIGEEKSFLTRWFLFEYFNRCTFNVPFHTFRETLSHIDTENARFRRNICIQNMCIAMEHCHMSIKWQNTHIHTHNSNSSLQMTTTTTTKRKREWILICGLEIAWRAA